MSLERPRLVDRRCHSIDDGRPRCFIKGHARSPSVIRLAVLESESRRPFEVDRTDPLRRGSAKSDPNATKCGGIN